MWFWKKNRKNADGPSPKPGAFLTQEGEMFRYVSREGRESWERVRPTVAGSSMATLAFTVQDGMVVIDQKGALVFRENEKGFMASRVLLEKESPDIDMEKVFAEHYRNMLEGFKKASPAQRGVISQLSDSLTDFLQGDAPRERPSKMEIAMRTAFLAAEGSTCNKLQVGAVLTDQDYAVVSSGFNGTPSGFPHCCDVYTYEEHTAKHDIHAEVNAIERCKWLPNQDEHSCLFVTHLPCMSCAKTIVAAKRRLNIKKVIFGEVYDNDDPTYEKYQSVEDIKTFLRQAGIELIAAVG